MTLSPADAIAAVESSLRLAIREVLPDWQAKVSTDAIRSLEAKVAEENKKRDGVAASSDLLDYTEFHQIVNLVLKNWEAFKPIFDDLQRTKVLLSLAQDYRNPTAHNRTLLDFEIDLLSGGAGQLRNQVAIYRSSDAGQSRFYPRIESAIDDFGRQGAPTEHESTPRIRVDVGDVLTFTCRAVQARHFAPQWKVSFVSSYPAVLYDPPAVAMIAEGEAVTLNYEVQPNDIGEERNLAIMLTTESKHHRHAVVDDYAIFTFAVNPPDDE